MTLNIFRPDRVNPLAKPPKSPEDQIKFDQLKARKARYNIFENFGVLEKFQKACGPVLGSFLAEKVQ